MENTERKINQYTADGALLKTWGGIAEIEKYFDRKNFPYFRMTLKGCLKDPSKRLAGYIWQYEDDSKIIAKRYSMFF